MTTSTIEKTASTLEAEGSKDTMLELEARLRRLERKVRGMVAEGGAGHSPSAGVGSYSSYSSRAGSSGATSDAMAAIEAKATAAAAELPAAPERALASSGGDAHLRSPSTSGFDPQTVDQAVAAALKAQLEAIDVEALARAAVEKRILETLKSRDVRQLVLDEAKGMMTGDRFRELVAETLKDGTLLDGKTPEQLTHDALKKVFDDDGEDSLLEKAMIKALSGRRPEELLSAKVGELFDRFSKKISG